MYYPAIDQLPELREQGNFCPIYREILADSLAAWAGERGYRYNEHEGGQGYRFARQLAWLRDR